MIGQAKLEELMRVRAVARLARDATWAKCCDGNPSEHDYDVYYAFDDIATRIERLIEEPQTLRAAASAAE